MTAARAALLAGLLALAGVPPGCALFERSTSNVDQVPDEGYLQFVNGTREDRIFVDGRPAGTGLDYSTDRLLAVTPGAHLLEVVRGGAVVLSERVYVGVGSTRQVVLR